MKRCPACNARYQGKETCHRCGMNIDALIDIKDRAQDHFQQAIRYFYGNDFEHMYFHARRSYSLFRSPESIQVLACAALMVNRFDMATTLWQQYHHCKPLCSR
ncbi:MAG: hypothetical protein HQK75_09370 [Candidatus Magnetomorum sp.]|nr:hypothetical protein [Candidatus Magnetomorum sp.]